MDRNSIHFLVRLLVWTSFLLHLSDAGRAQSEIARSDVSFEAAYEKYRSAIAADDYEAALQAAQQAYELGEVRFGRVHENVAALAMNYGRMLQIAGTDDAVAAELFSEADSIYEELHGPESQGRVNALMALASVQASYEAALETIRFALSMHRVVLPDDDVSYARQQAGGGELLAALGPDRAEATELLEDALAVLEKEIGKNSPELVTTLFALGSTRSDGEAANRRQLRYYDRALEIVANANADSPGVVADFELRAGLDLAADGPRGYANALRYVGSAHRRYQEQYGSNHPKTALAALMLGELYLGTNDYEAASAQLQNAILYYVGNPEDRTNLLRARRALASLVLVDGDETLFDEQLAEMAGISAEMTDPLELLAVVKYPPTHPREARSSRADGYVLVEFTVDEKGSVRNPVIIESHSGDGGGEIFHDAALEAIQRYRYIPRIENGVAVSVSGVRDTVSFEFERNSLRPLPSAGPAAESAIGFHEFNQ